MVITPTPKPICFPKSSFGSVFGSGDLLGVTSGGAFGSGLPVFGLGVKGIGVGEEDGAGAGAISRVGLLPGPFASTGTGDLCGCAGAVRNELAGAGVGLGAGPSTPGPGAGPGSPVGEGAGLGEGNGLGYLSGCGASPGLPLGVGAGLGMGPGCLFGCGASPGLVPGLPGNGGGVVLGGDLGAGDGAALGGAALGAPSPLPELELIPGELGGGSPVLLPPYKGVTLPILGLNCPSLFPVVTGNSVLVPSSCV